MRIKVTRAFLYKAERQTVGSVMDVEDGLGRMLVSAQKAEKADPDTKLHKAPEREKPARLPVIDDATFLKLLPKFMHLIPAASVQQGAAK